MEGFLLDRVRTRPPPEARLPVSWLTPEDEVAELQRRQAERARLAVRPRGQLDPSR